MKKLLITAGLVALCTACGNKEKEYDATGTFEATEITVYAEQSGVLLNFDVTEGNNVADGQEVGLIDTTQLWLKIRQLDAIKHVYASQQPDIQKLIASTEQQLAKAKLEEQRYHELVNDGAAPRKMLDDAESQVKVLERQLEALRSTLDTQSATLDAQTNTTQTEISQLEDQLRKCHIVAPTNGSILEKYVERGEFVGTGKPLFKLADIGQMFFRAYVTSALLQNIKIGQQVKVFADYGDNQRKEYNGIVSWISSQSEFTPKTILTDDERADLVYAVKVAVRNDGYIKIGMYGEVKF